MKLLPAHRRQVDKIRTYKAVFETADGKRVLHDLMKQHHILGALPARDTNEIFRAEGERNVVLRILSLLNIDPLKFEEHLKQGLTNESLYNQE